MSITDYVLSGKLERAYCAFGVLKGQKFPKELDDLDKEIIRETPEVLLNEEAAKLKNKL